MYLSRNPYKFSLLLINYAGMAQSGTAQSFSFEKEARRIAIDCVKILFPHGYLGSKALS